MRYRPLLGLALCPLLLSVGTLGCQEGGDAAPTAPTVQVKFEAARAWKHMEAQVALGPRPSGSEANAKLRDYLCAELESYGLTPVRQPFTASKAPGGPIEMENIYADLEGQPSSSGEPAPIICLGAHFDTKRMSFPFLGANDGASGVGVLLELARVLSSGPEQAVTYRFLFTDGEEAVRSYWMDPDNCYGSRHHVKQLTETYGALKRVKAFILLDLVADADLQLERDSNSTRELLALFESAATRLGHPDLFAKNWNPIRDDHEPFKKFGIPAVDLIDLHFGQRGNEYWHTDADTLENCSPQSVALIGELVLEALPSVVAKFGK